MQCLRKTQMPRKDNKKSTQNRVDFLLSRQIERYLARYKPRSLGSSQK